jgi:hypothetical protein
MNFHNHINRILSAALVLILVTLACSFKPNVTQIKTGTIQEVEIQIPLPEEPTTGVELNLEFVAGDLNLAPGTNGYLASGKATFNAVDFGPKVEATGSSYTLRQGDLEIEGVPVAQEDLINEWDLQLANTSMSLNIQAGAYNGNFELGGLSLEELTISQGGSDLTCKFSKPNLIEMSSFTFSTGGSSLELTGLANANFAQMNFSAGAGDYTLSFDGNLQRDANVMIDAGVGTVNLIVPEDVSAKLIFEGGLTTINMDGAWSQNGNEYTLSGSGPTITIMVKMGAGTLNIKTE